MKKKILLASIIALSLALLVAVGGTMAWLFVESTPVTNTFTPSDIAISLVETKGNEFKMIPGNNTLKDPIVTVTADLDCWVFVKVEKINNPDAYLEYDIDSVWQPVPGYTDVYFTILDTDNTQTSGSWNVLDCVGNHGEGCTGCFNVWDFVNKSDMDTARIYGNPALKFTAYAIQKDNFASAELAWAELNPTQP